MKNNSLVKINNNIDKPCKLFGPDGYIGKLENEAALDYVRVQIAHYRLSGYYVVTHTGERAKINVNGDLADGWPKSLFPFGLCASGELIGKQVNMETVEHVINKGVAL